MPTTDDAPFYVYIKNNMLPRLQLVQVTNGFLAGVYTKSTSSLNNK